MSGHKWRPLQRVGAEPPAPALVRAWSQEFGIDEAEARRRIVAYSETVELWANDLYQVEVERNAAEASARINIRRRDGFVGRDWRHFQQIKNEVVGAECEAVELYPAETRLVDTSNKFTLFACLDPTFRFPFGWTKRDVRAPEVNDVAGMRQRPLMQFDRRACDRDARISIAASAIPPDADLTDQADVVRSLLAARLCCTDFADVLDEAIAAAHARRVAISPRIADLLDVLAAAVGPRYGSTAVRRCSFRVEEAS
jgi:hypothetical protein